MLQLELLEAKLISQVLEFPYQTPKSVKNHKVGMQEQFGKKKDYGQTDHTSIFLQPKLLNLKDGARRSHIPRIYLIGPKLKDNG